jgi:hypothetical protein
MDTQAPAPAPAPVPTPDVTIEDDDGTWKEGDPAPNPKRTKREADTCARVLGKMEQLLAAPQTDEIRGRLRALKDEMHRPWLKGHLPLYAVFLTLDTDDGVHETYLFTTQERFYGFLAQIRRHISDEFNHVLLDIDAGGNMTPDTDVMYASASPENLLRYDDPDWAFVHARRAFKHPIDVRAACIETVCKPAWRHTGEVPFAVAKEAIDKAKKALQDADDEY